MRIAVATRIFEPEPSAASFRLAALAEALGAAGHEVTVLTVRPHTSMRYATNAGRRYRVRRFPVFRDADGYVRGYLQYMSFDIPLFFRILFGPHYDLVVVEPPPTTGIIVRAATWLRRIPYAYYAADIWSDAAAQTGASPLVLRVLAKIERAALSGATRVLSVSAGVTERLEELGITAPVATVGNGVNVAAFTPRGDESPPIKQEFVYAGTASEWHGAEIFVDAFPSVIAECPDARLRFIGGGALRSELARRAEALGVGHAVIFDGVVPPEILAPKLQQCAAALASVRPGAGYDFAFPTKLYSAAASGAPLLFCGVGPAYDFVLTRVEDVPLGTSVPYDSSLLAQAMIAYLRSPVSADRRETTQFWAQEHVSVERAARAAVQALALDTKK